MRRFHGEPIQVRRGQIGDREGPAQFVWRGRLYSVREVLDSWVETGAWWRSSAISRIHGLAEDSSSPVSTGPVSVAGLVDDECEVWRVEAAAGRESPRGVFDISFAWATGEWLLLGAHD